MKKTLILLLTLALLLCAVPTAMAINHPCDLCGGATTMTSAGSTCHWYCADCDYTTVRNHDPNSAHSGLVPDSCSGSCRYCGNPADFSSHTFTNYVFNNDSDCTTDGTETAKCDNVQCSATHTRTAVGSALGHDPDADVIEPLCEEGGYTIFTCKRCGVVYNGDFTNPTGHAYGEWAYNGDGTHTAPCTRANCLHAKTVDCTMTEMTIGGQAVSICTVCGRIAANGAEGDVDGGEGVTGSVETTSLGKLVVLVDPAPLAVEIPTPALYMMVAEFQRTGVPVAFSGLATITIDLNEHPFVMEEGKYANVPAAELKAEAVKVVRVENAVVDGKTVETWTEMEFTLENGVLTFKTDRMGVFLLVDKDEQPPVTE